MTESEKENISSEEVPREFLRTQLSKSVKVHFEKKEFLTLLKDVSLGGVKLEWPTPQKEDTALTVHFSTDLYFDGTIRWCKSVENQYEIGVQFPDLDEIAAIYFGEYIEQLQEAGPDLIA